MDEIVCKTERRRELLLILLCSVVYFCSYILRYDYAASMLAIMKSLEVEKTAVSVAVTVSFVTYGVGQLLGGWMGDRIKPQLLIFAGIAGSALCNLTISMQNSVGVITAVWGCNGFFQSLVWPPLVRLMVESLSGRGYKKACVWVSAACNVGTILTYLTVPVWITVSGWRLAFIVPAVFALVFVCGVWLPFSGKLMKKPDGTDSGVKVEDRSGEAVTLRQVRQLAGLLPILLAITLQGLLRDGISTWMPVYISEQFAIGDAMSILTTTLLPIFAVVSIAVASRLQESLHTEMNTVALLYGVSTIAAMGLLAFYSRSAVVSVICLTVVNACTHGTNLMLVSRVPSRFAQYGRISTISGVLNAFTYVGSSISGYGFGAVCENMGWGFTFTLWLAIAVAGFVCAFIARKKWNSFVG